MLDSCVVVLVKVLARKSKCIGISAQVRIREQCGAEEGVRGAFLRGCVTNRADDLVVFFECVCGIGASCFNVSFCVMVLGMVRFIFASGRIKLLYW